MQNICNQCGGELRHIKAGVSKKTGKPYNAFNACENGCKQFRAYNPQKPARGANFSNGGGYNSNQGDGLAIVLEEIQRIDKGLNERMDNMGVAFVKLELFLKEKFK